MNINELTPLQWRQYLLDGIENDEAFHLDLIRYILGRYDGTSNTFPKLSDTPFSNLIETTSNNNYKINTDVLNTLSNDELQKWKRWTLRSWTKKPEADPTSTSGNPTTTSTSGEFDPISHTNSYEPVSRTVPYNFDRFNDLSVLTSPPRNTKPTDWMAHLLNRFLSTNANNKIANLEKLYKVPLELQVTKQAITTTGSYLTLQLLEKRKLEMLAKYNNKQTSNMDYNLALMNLAQQQVDQYEDKLAALLAENFASINKSAVDIANWNAVEAGEAKHAKSKADSAMMNYKLAAEQKRVLNNALANKSFIYDTYVDSGKKAQYDRDLQAQLYLSELLAKYYLQDAAIDREAEFWSDVANWPNLSLYIVELAGSGYEFEGEEKDIINRWAGRPDLVPQGLKSDPLFRNLVLQKFAEATDPVTKRYKSLFEDYLEKLNTRVQQQKDYLGGMYLARRNSVNTASDNQLWEYKKGGKVQLLKEYIKGKQKELESVRKNANEYHKRASKELSAQLGALDKEQLLLLKSIFK